MQPRDKYGRTLAWVWLKKGERLLLVNEIITRNGLAMPFTLAPNVKYTDRIIKAFRLARKEKRGFWGRAFQRIFTSEQAWSQLPTLSGKFITLKLTIQDIKQSSTRLSLIDLKGHMRLVIYKDDLPRFSHLKFKKGLKIKAAGKLRVNYFGGEMKLADPIQILDVEL